MSVERERQPRPGALPAARVAYSVADPAAREQTILRHLPLIKYVAARLAMGLPAHIEIDDLYSYGVFGLLDAMERFDPSRGIKFETYAYTRVKGAILDGLRGMDWVPASLRHRAREVEAAFGRVEAREGRAAEDADVAEELGLDPADFAHLMSELERGAVLSLDEMWGEEDGEERSLRDVVADEGAMDPTEGAEGHERQRVLAEALEALPPRERTVLTLLYYDGLVPKEIAQVLGVSVSRISQLHSQAVLRLRGHLGQKQRSLL